MEESRHHLNSDLLTGPQQPLPNATTVLVLGILSIVTCFICGIIALSIASGDRQLYQNNPNLYTTASYDMIKAGRICAIVSLCIWAVGIMFYVFFFIFFFTSGHNFR